MQTDSTYDTEAGRFLSVFGHDLRNALAGVHGSLEILADGTMELSREEIAELAAGSLEAADRMKGMTDGLLLLGRLRMARGAAAGRVELRRLAERLLERERDGEAGRRGLRLVNAVEAGLAVQAEALALETGLRQLVSNAVRFTPDGGEVRLEAAAQEPGRVAVTVRDEGPGLTEERVAGIFRMDSGRVTPGAEGREGAGLGLIVAREAARRLGGELIFKAGPAGGTEAGIVLKVEG